MPLESQAKILKVLEDGSITRVGGRRPIPVDLRLVTATHRNLEEACAKGDFRQDLFFRLNVIRLHLPPLRERREDIPLLARHFLDSALVRYGLQPMRFAPETVRLLEAYAWPGNVRELEHEVERCALLAASRLIHPPDLSPHLLEALHLAPLPAPVAPTLMDPGGELGQKLREHPDLLAGIFQRIAAYTAQSLRLEKSAPASRLAARAKTRAAPQNAAALAKNLPGPHAAETDLVLKTLASCGQNKSRAARQLGITREGLRKKLKRLGLA
jgi:DNA-binding NtrC family response regulator